MGSMILVFLIGFIIIFYLLPKYNVEGKYIGVTAILLFFTPFIIMYYVRNFLINKLILKYKNDMREIMDRTVMSGDIEEDLYVNILRNNKLENFSLEKPDIETPDLNDCEELINFKENLILINDKTYNISKITHYSLKPNYNRHSGVIYYFTLFIRINYKEYNEIIDTKDPEKIFRIGKMLYKSLLEYNIDFDFPSIKISQKAKGIFKYNKY